MDENYPYLEDEFGDHRMDMHSDWYQLKIKIIVYGFIIAVVFFGLLPWGIGIAEMLTWVF